jgi:hypothetical protein
MSKTLKTGKNKSTKKVVRRSKNKTSHKKTTTKLQKGGAISWERYTNVKELSIADIIRESPGEVRVENSGPSTYREICKFTQEQFDNLKRIIHENTQLQKLDLSQYYIIIDGTVVNPSNLANTFIDVLLTSESPGILKNLKDLNLNCQDITKSYNRLPFNTDMLVNFFNKNQSVKLDTLDLRGWKFTLPGLYNLCNFQCSGRVSTLIIDSKYPLEEPFGSNSQADYTYIEGDVALNMRDMFLVNMRQLELNRRFTTVLATDRLLISEGLPNFGALHQYMDGFKVPFKLESEIRNTDLLSLAGLEKESYARAVTICQNLDKATRTRFITLDHPRDKVIPEDIFISFLFLYLIMTMKQTERNILFSDMETSIKKNMGEKQ